MRRRQLGLRTRATVAFALIAATLAGGLTVAAYGLTRGELLGGREDTVLSQGYLNARLLRNTLRAPEPDITSSLASLEANAGTVILARVGGEWYSGSVGLGPDALPSPLTDRVGVGEAAYQRIRLEEDPYLALGVAVPSVDAQYYELVPLQDIELALARLGRGLLIGAVVATLAGAAVGWYASGRVLRPLHRMATAAAGIAEGTLDTRLDAVGDPHLRALERSFNHMADTIQERIDREARFTSDVSHELRSPVSAMLSTIEIARRRMGDPAASEEALNHLHDRVENFHRLVLDLLEISRADAGVAALQLEPLNAAELVHAVLRSQHRADVAVDVVTDEPPLIRGDKRRLGQMVANLLENADRYAGGATRIEVGRDGDRVIVAVEDEGPGVLAHERTHIFERFARGEAARASVTGTGLGLALVAEHARLHGGSIRLDDSEVGARFVIDLPALDPSVAPA